MKSIRTPALVLLVSLAALAGCAGLPAKEASNADRVCVFVRQINSFDALDDRHVVVGVSARRHYLFTVDGSCSGLTFAEAITIADPTTRVCGDGFGFLSFRHPGIGTKRCRIDEIVPVESREAALALIESRATDSSR